jgi:prepilin-type processing-associated H-X9-DG protein
MPMPGMPPIGANVNTGMAVGALVCGIIGMVGCPLVGVVGVILGIVAILRANREPHRYGGKGMAIGGICTGGVSLLFMPIILLAIFLPSLSQAGEMSMRLVCAANLKGIGTSVLIYANENDDAYPPSLQTFIDSGEITPKQCICPSSGAVVGDGVNACYIYIPGTRVSADDPRNVMAYEPPENHGGEGSNVVFVDGHCTFIRPYSEVERLVAETKARLAATAAN